MKIIQIYDKHYQECDVVMLPTNKESNLFIGDLSSQLHYNYSIEKGKSINQHLYILSNEEIKEDDWYINNGVLFKADTKFDEGNNPNINNNNKKVIATTDSSLTKEMYCVSSGKYQEPLPQIPQQFIEHYISEYNNGNVITKVLVEVEEAVVNTKFNIHLNEHENIIEWFIVINPNNEISILTEKCEYMKEVGCIKDICICNTGPKQETLEEAAETTTIKYVNEREKQTAYLEFIEGAKWQSERMYNREKVVELLTLAWATASAYGDNTDSDDCSSWIKENLK
jgi:hypothetical protein